MFFFGILTLLFPLWAANLIALPLLLILSIFKETRKRAKLFLVFCLAFTLLGVISIKTGNKVRMHGFEKLAQCSAPLVAAINKYEKDRGSPPSALPDLVPEYLPEIPSTGMKAYPEYVYERSEGADYNTDYLKGNSWMLYISTPSVGISFDCFIYFPKGNYPESTYGVKRLGDWAYCQN